MAVIVAIKEKGNYDYSSVKGVGIPEEEKENARKLNDLTKKEMSKFNSKKHLKGKLKNKVELYWRFGSVLRNIFKTGLVIPGERKIYWKNVRLHAPAQLLAKDRGPNRIHIEYCFRLAGYPKNLVLRRKWSEWVYLFDSPSINKENRFDDWDKNKIKKEEKYLSRGNTRLFIQCLNSILENKKTKDLNDDELLSCYEGAWQLTKSLAKNKTDVSKDKIKKVINDQNNLVGKIIGGEISPENFAEIIKNGI